MDVGTAFAVVYASDGSRHKVCWSSEDVLAAVDDLVSAGVKPVVFHRIQRPNVTNINSGGGSGVQAGTIIGGVHLR